MSDLMNRRRFLQQAAAAGVGMGLAGPFLMKARGQGAPSQRIRVAMIGVNGRGTALSNVFSGIEGSEIAYVCDVDERAMAKVIKSVTANQGTAPRGEKDFRRVLERDDVDAVVIAMPDHWHAPAAIMAMAAGKHVYLEKPGSHNPREAELVVAATRKYNRVCQLGNQRPSWPKVAEAIELVRSGAIGDVRYVRCWYANRRDPIGNGKHVPVPEWLDWELWQGPAPREDFRDNIVHYNWHWFWNWATGEAGNNAVHALDLARRGLNVDYPTRVTSLGGRLYHEDDWEAMDTQIINYEFPDKKMVIWEGQSCNRFGALADGFGATFHGWEGTLHIPAGDTYTIYDEKGKEVRKAEAAGEPQQAVTTRGPGFARDAPHGINFLDGIRNGTPLISEIEYGQKSTMMTHLGNIAQRTNTIVECDPQTGRILNNPAAQALWGREYQPGWEPKV